MKSRFPPFVTFKKLLNNQNLYFFKPMICFGVSSAHDLQKGVQLQLLRVVILVVPASFVASTQAFLLNCLFALIENQLAVNERLYFWIISFIPWRYVHPYANTAALIPTACRVWSFLMFCLLMSKFFLNI